MRLSKKQKLAVLGSDFAFAQRLTYIEELSLQLRKITGRTKFVIRTEGKIAWSIHTVICEGCKGRHDFKFVLKLCLHCIIHVPITSILNYKRACGSTEHRINNFYYSAINHLVPICDALEQAIVDAHKDKFEFIYKTPEPESSDRFSGIEL